MERNRSTGSFLAPGNAAEEAQEKAARALCTSWAGMRMVAHYPDADEGRDPNETGEYTVEFVHRIDFGPTDCFACTNRSDDCDLCEKLAEKKEKEEDTDLFLSRGLEAADEDLYDEDPYYDVREFYRDLADLFEPEGSFVSMNDAKKYTRLGAPMVRGRMRHSAILRLSRKFF